jgi:flagellar biosynthetic protein FlhB
MAEAAAQEKTEKATPRRRQDARKKGQVAQSKEISSVLILMTIMGIFYFAGSWIFYNLSGIFTGIYGNIGTLSLNNATEADLFLHTVFEYLISILIPIFLPIVAAAVVANIAQVGFEMHGQPLQPKLSKLNPISGMKKFVSLKSMVELVKSMFKIVIVGGVAYVIVEKEMHYFPSLMVLIFLAALDYVYQRWQHEKSLKMTKQEVKDERKQTEGDPKIKARIRSIQLEMAQRRMMEAIPEADVVITNPTHLALAIKFDAKEMIAPTVLAKGSGFIAERIKEVAREHNVPIIEDKPLAQAMFKLVEIGDFIPIELYRAVAEVLAYVYRLKGQYAGA